MEMAMDGLQGSDFWSVARTGTLFIRPTLALLLLPSCPIHLQMRGRAPLRELGRSFAWFEPLIDALVSQHSSRVRLVCTQTCAQRMHAGLSQHMCTSIASDALASKPCSKHRLLSKAILELFVAFNAVVKAHVLSEAVALVFSH